MKKLKDGIDVKGKQPCFYFYPADYERDMAPLPLDAQGLWARMLCNMHWAKRRGYLEHGTGAAITPDDLARIVGQPLRTVNRCIAELERIGVFSRDANNVIYCRRMAKDSDISRKRAEAAAARVQGASRNKDGTFAGEGNEDRQPDAGTFAGSKPPATEPAKTEQKSVPSPSPSLSPSPSPSGFELIAEKSISLNSDGFPVPPPRGQSWDSAQADEILKAIGWDGIKKATPEQIAYLESLEPSMFPNTCTLADIRSRLIWFNEFWDAYWRSAGKKDARAAYFKAAKSIEAHQAIIAAVESQTPTMLKREEEHRPHAATWLNAERWNDTVHSSADAECAWGLE